MDAPQARRLELRHPSPGGGGQRPAGDEGQFTARKGPVAFSAIHAVQIIKERVNGDDSDYWSYELNLVLKDGARINVMDHANLAGISSDALRISALVGCKVWDGATPQR